MTVLDEAFDSMIECPLCRDAGVMSISGRVPHLFVDPRRDPPVSCPGIHGPMSAEVLRAHGVGSIPLSDPGSGLAPSGSKDVDPDLDVDAPSPQPGPPDGVSELEQQSAYRDAPHGDVVEEDQRADDER